MYPSGQWADVISLHVCSYLRVPDLQALGATCSFLHRIVHELPSATWEAIAINTLPAAHPLLSLTGHNFRDHIQRAARATRTLPSPKTISLGQGDPALFVALENHEGSQIIIHKGDRVAICQLNLGDGGPAPLHLIFIAAPHTITNKQHSRVSLAWSGDDCYAAVHYCLHDDSLGGCSFARGCFFAQL
ncbi:hypothetical protein WJX73_002353 [Symbiochloris irregularis]|uniref:F-box domain-containing protein n=1 Tax=Symbiochloris irregularis TaxID=706552 RepID=A0AAW1NYH6_9CHLO